MRRVFLALCFLLSACASAIPIRLADDTPNNRKLVREAVQQYLQVGVEFVDRPYRAVSLDLTDAPHGVVQGRSLISTGCQRAAWAVTSAATIAHELGHAAGRLEHSPDPDNVMYPTVGAEPLSSEQRRAAGRAVRRLRLCL